MKYKLKNEYLKSINRKTREVLPTLSRFIGTVGTLILPLPVCRMFEVSLTSGKVDLGLINGAVIEHPIRVYNRIHVWL